MLPAALCLAALSLVPQDPTKSGDSPDAPKTAAAREGTLRATLERKGRLVPVDAMPVKLDFDAYGGPSKVVDVVQHGRPVNRGDVLVRFATDEIDEQIHEAEFELELAELAAKDDEKEVRLAEAAARDELAQAERRLQWARRKLQGYLEHELEFARESDRMSKQSTQYRLEDQQDELTQLEKMYEEDELVDATEEIVIKRSRRDLAMSQAWAKLSERRTKYEWDFEKAMERERLEQSTEMEGRGLDRLRERQEIARSGRELAARRAHFALEKKRRKLEDLRRDRERLTVRAERSGLLLHGEVDSAPGSKEVEVGDRASAGSVLMTIVDPDRFEVRTDVPETHLYRAGTGKAAKVELTALPDEKLVGSIRVALLPTGREGDVNLYRTTVPVGEQDPRYRPGMGCKVTIVLDVVEDAVLVPLAAVKTEDGRKIVRCGKSASGPFEERAVVTGPDDGEEVVIVEGVKTGDFVVIEEKKK